MRSNIARLLLAAVAVAAIVAVMLVTGWADDKAPPGSRGRVPLTQTAPDAAP